MIPKIFLLCALFFGSSFGAYLSSYDALMSQAKKENKIAMALLVSSYCPWCKRMESETLTDPKVKALLEKDFVSAIIHKDQDSSLPKYLRPRLVPTVYFLNHEGHVISETFGYKKAEYFLDDIDRAQYMFESN